ncbi:hypothetical protein EC988_005139 [Linderina pennispora]|nr:hypothetical protein EC988_005139 [Linderina pennispora]
MAGAETIIPILGSVLLLALFIAAYIKTEKSERIRILCCLGPAERENEIHQSRPGMTERTSTRYRDDADNLSGCTLAPDAASPPATRNSHVVQVDRPRTPSYVYMVMM